MSVRSAGGRRTPPRRGGSGFVGTLVLLVMLLAAVVSFLAWFVSRGPGDQGVLLAGSGDEIVRDWSGARNVWLVYPSSTGRRVLTAEVQLPATERRADDILAVLRELSANQPPRGAVRAIPRGAEPQAVFLDEARGGVVVDYSTALTAAHPGGSAAERATLTSILRTIALNFPDLERCRLLVDGAEVATLAGHLRMDEPFDLRRWR